jgi:transcription initiation factor IIE alpha subunit
MTDKQKVIKLFKSNKVLYFSDISKKLNMDLKKVVKICLALYKEGKIQVHKKGRKS